MPLRLGERRIVKKKGLILFMAALMLASAWAGGTLSYLTDISERMTNTFTVGNVDITLTENLNKNQEIQELRMVPGNVINREPIVTVAEESEDCWLFVQLEKSDNLDEFITCKTAEGWHLLSLESGVYYREVSKEDAVKSFAVLEGNQVLVNTEVTKEMMDAIAAHKAEAPTLTFTAYAVQRANIETVQAAWEQICQAAVH